MRNSDQILHGACIKLDARIIFYEDEIFGDTNADARSVCGS